MRDNNYAYTWSAIKLALARTLPDSFHDCADKVINELERVENAAREMYLARRQRVGTEPSESSTTPSTVSGSSEEDEVPDSPPMHDEELAARGVRPRPPSILDEDSED